MNTEQSQNTAPKRVLITREKIDIMNAKKFTVGTEFSGTWYDTRSRLVTDRKTMELKEVTDLLFKTDNNDLFAIPLDAGLRVALSEYNVKEGEFISMEKLPKMQYNGNDVNQYKIQIYS